jgi:hypothetical protein
MTDPHVCDAVQVLLSDLATGAATGEDRARAVEHLAECAACRREVAELARAADTLLLLAPRVEPPAGFEARVIGGLEAHPPAAHQPRHWASLGRRVSGWFTRRSTREPAATASRPRPSRRLRLAAGAVALAVAAFAGGAAAAERRTADDRRLAEHYRQTLEVANGRYLSASPLIAADGSRAGSLFLYQGNPSWLLVSVTAAPADGAYRMTILDRAGDLHYAGTCRIVGRTGTAGYRLPVPASNVAEVQLHAPTPTVAQLTARPGR